MSHLEGARQTRERISLAHPIDATATASLMFGDRRSMAFSGRPGDVTTEILRFGADGSALGRVTSTGHEIDLHEHDNITILLPMAGRIDMQIGDEAFGFVPSNLAFVMTGRRRTKVAAPPGAKFSAVSLQIPTGRIQALAIAQEAKTAMKGGRKAIVADNEIGRYVAKILPSLVSDLFRQPDTVLPNKVLADFEGLIDDVLSDVIIPAGKNPGPRLALREHRRACLATDIMHAHGDEPLSIAHLSQQLGITARSLQIAFNAVHGISPRQYLEHIRLQRVRQRLLSHQDACSITTVAFECGFTHLGRFSQAYRNMFGERPSQTRSARSDDSVNDISQSG